MPTTKILIRESEEGDNLAEYATYEIEHPLGTDLQVSRTMWLSLLQATSDSLLIVSKDGKLKRLDTLVVQVSFED